jgi:hypothetical protein
MDSSLMIDEETRGIVNFIVYYAIDDEKAQHNLELQFYGGGPTAAFGNWVLLEPAPSASGAHAEGTAAPALADGAPTSTATPRSLPPHGFTDDGMAAKSDQPKRWVWRPQWKPPNGAVAKRRTGRLENALAENARAPALEGGSPAAAATVVARMPAVRANSFEWLPADPPAPAPAPAPECRSRRKKNG